MLRALIAWFWDEPYRRPLIRFGTDLHDRFMLPHYVWRDFEDICADLARAGLPIKAEWFKTHFEFRFPYYGDVTYRDVTLELRAGTRALARHGRGRGHRRHRPLSSTARSSGCRSRP